MTTIDLIAAAEGSTRDDLAASEHVAPESAGGAGVAYPVIPAGIGLQLGALAITLGLLSCAYAHLYSVTAAGIIVPVAFSVGAVAIFVGGVINFRAGIMVAGMIGVLYGTFWLSVALLLQFDTASVGSGLPNALGTYFLIWGIMSLGLCLPVFFVSKVVFTQQLLLAVVFFVLAGANYSTSHSDGIQQLGGWLGIVDALFCFYISMSLVTNETAGKTVLPLP